MAKNYFSVKNDTWKIRIQFFYVNWFQFSVSLYNVADYKKVCKPLKLSNSARALLYHDLFSSGDPGSSPERNKVMIGGIQYHQDPDNDDDSIQCSCCCTSPA